MALGTFKIDTKSEKFGLKWPKLCCQTKAGWHFRCSIAKKKVFCHAPHFNHISPVLFK